MGVIGVCEVRSQDRVFEASGGDGKRVEGGIYWGRGGGIG